MIPPLTRNDEALTAVFKPQLIGSLARHCQIEPDKVTQAGGRNGRRGGLIGMLSEVRLLEEREDLTDQLKAALYVMSPVARGAETLQATLNYMLQVC